MAVTSARFDLSESMEAIRSAAIEGRFLTYGALALAAGAEWRRVRPQLNRHLRDLTLEAHRQGLPIVTSIIVNKANLDTGRMAPATVAGFADVGRRLGYDVGDDEAAFFSAQQRAVFVWGAAGAPVPWRGPRDRDADQAGAEPCVDV